jgi:hypothetical protein
MNVNAHPLLIVINTQEENIMATEVNDLPILWGGL